MITQPRAVPRRPHSATGLNVYITPHEQTPGPRGGCDAVAMRLGGGGLWKPLLRRIVVVRRQKSFGIMKTAGPGPPVMAGLPRFDRMACSGGLTPIWGLAWASDRAGGNIALEGMREPLGAGAWGEALGGARAARWGPPGWVV